MLPSLPGHQYEFNPSIFMHPQYLGMGGRSGRAGQPLCISWRWFSVSWKTRHRLLRLQMASTWLSRTVICLFLNVTAIKALSPALTSSYPHLLRRSAKGQIQRRGGGCFPSIPWQHDRYAFKPGHFEIWKESDMFYHYYTQTINSPSSGQRWDFSFLSWIHTCAVTVRE